MKAGRGPLKDIVAKVIRFVQFLSARRFGADVYEIAEEMGCSRRQAYRYIASLTEGGIRIEKYYAAGHRTRWRIVNQREFLSKMGIL